MCSHRRHLRLDNLRTLVLADNHLSRIQLATDDDGDFSNNEDDESERVSLLIVLNHINLHLMIFRVQCQEKHDLCFQIYQCLILVIII